MRKQNNGTTHPVNAAQDSGLIAPHSMIARTLHNQVIKTHGQMNKIWLELRIKTGGGGRECTQMRFFQISALRFCRMCVQGVLYWIGKCWFFMENAHNECKIEMMKFFASSVHHSRSRSHILLCPDLCNAVHSVTISLHLSWIMENVWKWMEIFKRTRLIFTPFSMLSKASHGRISLLITHCSDIVQSHDCRTKIFPRKYLCAWWMLILICAHCCDFHRKRMPIESMLA